MNYLFFGTSGETNNTEQTGTIDIPPLEYDILARPDINLNYDFITFEEIKDSKGYIFYTKNNPNYIDHEPSELEMEIIDEINLVRKNPKAYFDNYMAENSRFFNPDKFNICKNALYNQNPLPELKYKKGLFRVANDQVNTQIYTTKQGYNFNRINKTSFENIIKNYGTFKSVNESFTYTYSTPRRIVMELLVDTNCPSTPYDRQNILSSKYDCIGVATSPHIIVKNPISNSEPVIEYDYMTVLDFAENWKDK